MYYVELIDRFWIFNEKTRPGHTAIAVYLYLLKTAKDRESYQFSVSDVELGKRLGLTRTTVKATKEKLQDFGLIQYRTMNGVAGKYRLILNYPLEVLTTKNPQNAVVGETLEYFNGDNRDEIEANGETEKNDTGNSHGKMSESFEIRGQGVNVPELDDFLEYAKTLDSYTQELDALIVEKYSNWMDNGWKSLSGRFITDWRSSLKNILPFLSAEIKDIQRLTDHIPNIRHPKQ